MKWFLISIILCYLTSQCFGESDFNDDGDLLEPSQSHVLSMLQNDMERVYATVLPSDINMATILPTEVPHTPSLELHEIGSLRFKRAAETNTDGSGDQTTASTSSATDAEGSGGTTVQSVTEFDTTTSATTTHSTDGNATGVGTVTPEPNQTTPDTPATTQESTTPKVESTTVPYSTDTGTTLETSTPTVDPTNFTSTFTATETQTGSGDDETTTLVTQTTSAIDTSTTDVSTDAISTFTTTSVQTESSTNETTIPMTQTTGALDVSTTDVTSSVVGTTPSDTTQFTETSTQVPDTQTGSTPVETTVLTTQVGSTSVATTSSSVTASTAQVTGSGDFESTTALDTTATVFEPMTTIDTTAISTTGVSATDTTVTFSTSDSSTTVATTGVDGTTAVDDTNSIIETIFTTATFVNASTMEFRNSFSNALEDLLNEDTSSEGSGSRDKRAVGTTSGTVNVTVVDSSNLENLTVRVDYVVCDNNGNLIPASEIISSLNSTVNSTEYEAAISAAIGVNVTDILVFAEPASNAVTPTSTLPITSAVTADVTPSANTTDVTTVDATPSSNTTDVTLANTTDVTTVDFTPSSNTTEVTPSANTTDFTTVDFTPSSNTTEVTPSANTTDFTTVDFTPSSNTTEVTPSANTTDFTTVDFTPSSNTTEVTPSANTTDFTTVDFTPSSNTTEVTPSANTTDFTTVDFTPSSNTTEVTPSANTTDFTTVDFTPSSNTTEVTPSANTTDFTTVNFTPSSNTAEVTPSANTTDFTTVDFTPSSNTTEVTPSANTTDFTTVDFTPSSDTTEVTPSANTTDFTTVDFTPFSNTAEVTPSVNTTDFTTVDFTPSSNTTEVTPSANTTDFTTVDFTPSSNTSEVTTIDVTPSLNTTVVTTVDVTVSTVATTQSTSAAINVTSATTTLPTSSVVTSSSAPITTTTATITNDTYIVVTSFLLTGFTDATSENFRVDLAQVLSSLYNNVTTTSARRRRADGTYGVTVESGANSGTDDLAVEARYFVTRAGSLITGREASVVFSSVSDSTYSAALIPKFGDNTILRKSISVQDLAAFAAIATDVNYILTEFTLPSAAAVVTPADLKNALETIYNGIGANLSSPQSFVAEMFSVSPVSGTNVKAQYYVILSNNNPTLLRSLDAILFLGNLNNETYGRQLALQVNVRSVIQKASPVNVGNTRNATEIQSVLQLGNYAVFSRLTNTTETTYNVAITDILRRSYSNVGFNVVVLIYGFYNGTCVACNDLVYVVSIIEDGTFASSAYAAGSAWSNVDFINNEFSRNVIPGDVSEIRPDDISTCNDVTTYAYIDLLRNPPSDTQAALAKLDLVNGIKSAFAASYPNNNLEVCHVVASGLLTVTMGLTNPNSIDLTQPNYCRALLRVYDYPTRFNDATQFDNTSAVGLFITETNQCTATIATTSCIDPTLFWVIVGLLIFFVLLFILVVLLFIYCYCCRKADTSYEVNRGRETTRQLAPPAPVTERFEVQREPVVQHSVHVAEPVAPVVAVATKSSPKRRKPSKATRESEPELEVEEPRYRPSMSSLIEPTAFMGPSGNSNGVTRFRTTVHPIALPPIQPPMMTERLRRNADELDSLPGPRRRKSRPRVVEDDALQLEYEKAQSSLDEILSPRQPAVFDAPKRKRLHKRRGELDLRHPAHDSEIDELLDPPGSYVPMDSSRLTTDRPPEAMRERIHALLDDAFSLVSPRNIVAPVGSTDSGISPSTPLYSNSLDDIGSLSMPHPQGYASNLPTHRDFGSPRNEGPLFTRVVPPLVRTPRTGTEPVSFYTPASATPSGESAYITPVRRVPSPAGNGTVWTPYRAFDEVQRLRGELTNGARPHSAPTSDPMTFTPSLVHDGDDVKLPVTSLPGSTFNDPNSVPDSTAQMVQEVRDELARLAGVRPATGT